MAAPVRFGVRGRSPPSGESVGNRSRRHTSRRTEVIIKSTKRKTLNINGVPVTPAQSEVHRVLSSYPKGLPDHALVPLAQHVSGVRLSSSGIRTRRKELFDVGLVKRTTKTVTTGSGRPAAVYRIA